MFQGCRASCRVELCRTRVNFAAHPSGYGQDLFLLPFWRQFFGAEIFPRLPLVFHCSSAVAFGCERNSTDPAHIRRQMRWALRLDESLREQLKTKSDIHPLNLCSEDLSSCSAESGDALKPSASYFLLTNDGVCTDSLLSSKRLSDPKFRRVVKTECRTFWLEEDRVTQSQRRRLSLRTALNMHRAPPNWPPCPVLSFAPSSPPSSTGKFPWKQWG